MNQDQFILRQATITRTVRKVLVSRTNDLHLLDDLSQEVLLVCWEHAQAHGTLPSEPLVVTIALNLHRSWLRKLNRGRKLRELLGEREEGSLFDNDTATTERTDLFRVLISVL